MIGGRFVRLYLDRRQAMSEQGNEHLGLK